MTKKFTRVSAVGAVVGKIVNEPAAATAIALRIVVSLVATVSMITLFTVTSELVTTSELAAAAKLTDPLGLLMVCAPVVAAAVMVFRNEMPPALVIPMCAVTPPSAEKTMSAENE